MSVDPVVSGSPEVSGPAQPDAAQPCVVQPGDTLSAIARRLQEQGMPGSTAELVRTIARLNGISNPDRIEVGQVLTLPTRPLARTHSEDPVVVAGTAPRLSLGSLFSAAERQTLLQGALLRLTRGWSAPAQARHPRGPDGTPLFRQGDPAWRTERLGVAGDGPTLAHAGCAVTACAMALSRLGGTLLTPDALVRHLREAGGFQGPLVDWGVAGAAVRGAPRACPGELDGPGMDRELDAGRPVLLRVTHDVQGLSRQHWICLTGRDPRTGQYTANDPATGHTTALVRSGGALASVPGEPVRYASDGRMVTFSPGPARQA